MAKGERRRQRAAIRERRPPPRAAVPPTPGGSFRPLLTALAPLAPWAGPLAIALAGALMLAWSWRTWPDVIIDFGRELYTPWQITGGKVLYVDVAYFNGPLSPYLNTLWFRLFGASLLTLVWCNVALMGVLVALLYALLSETGGRLAASAACLAFVVLFGFGGFVSNGNYNFVTPYSHELTHGLLLVVTALFCLSRYQRSRHPGWLAGVGLALGLAFLTKPEIMLAGALSSGTGMALTLRAERPLARRLVRLLGVLVGAAALPLVLTFALFCLVMPAGEALRLPLGYWFAAFRGDVTSLQFYRSGLGTLDTGASLRALAVSVFWYAVLFAPAVLLSLGLGRPGRHRPALAVALFVVMATVLGWNWERIKWLEAGRPLPLFMLALGGAALWRVGTSQDGASASRLTLRVAMAVLAFAMLLKMILNARIYHYGFALAMPATLLLVVALLEWIPAFLARRGGYGPAFRAAALAVLLVAAYAHLEYVRRYFALKPNLVGQGVDAFLADGRGVLVRRLLEDIRTRLRPEQTLTVLPEGVMINYLSRHSSPTPYIAFDPVSVVLWGEERMLASLRARPPDFIVLAHRNTRPEGFDFFGRGFAQELDAWIQQEYRRVALFGSEPFKDQRYGIVLMQRRDAS